MKKSGMLIAFEGIDGSGKHTQIALLRKSLRGRVKILRYPNLKGKFGPSIRLFLFGRKKLSPDQQFALFSRDIAKDKSEIKSLLSRGFVVILDRFISSTVAYQSAKGLDFKKATRLAKSRNLPKPDITVLLDIPAKAALERKWKQKLRLHEFEKDVAFQERVRKAFRLIAEKRLFSKKWVLLDARLPPAAIHGKIKAKIRLSSK